MKNIVIIGCGQGIGFAAAKILSENHNVIGISRTENPEVENLNIKFYPMDILSILTKTMMYMLGLVVYIEATVYYCHKIY